MSDLPSAYRMFSPEQSVRANESKSRRRSISMSLHETATPAVKSLSSLDSSDVSIANHLSLYPENTDLQSAYDKLTVWKRTIEKHLNRVYLHKLKEIDHLLANGQQHIDVAFGTMPTFDQLAVVSSREPSIDHTYDHLEFDGLPSSGLELTSNNILLCTSDQHALIFDDVKSKLILYDDHACVHSFAWNINEHGEPCDLTYSSYLDLFCIITNRGLFTWSFDHESVPMPIESIKSIAGNRMWAMASTEARADVFILFKLGSYIERWNSIVDAQSWQHVQRWSNHDLFERNDQRVRSIRMTSAYVAWTVESTKTSEWRVDLLDYHLQILRQGISIDHLDRSSSCLLSNFGPEQFLIIDSNRHRLFSLDGQGTIRRKTDALLDKRIRNASLMSRLDRQWLVVKLEQPNQLCFIALAETTTTTTTKESER